MKFDELVSVIIPVYNVEEYLTCCVKSVMRQTYTNIEIILVDDGSTDKSGIMCDELQTEDSRISVIHKSNGGLSDARNIGISKACGRYTALIDSDDFVSDDYIEVLLKAMNDNDADIVQCKFAEVSEKCTVYSSKKSNHIKIYDREHALKDMLYQKKLNNSAWGKLYKTDALKKYKYPVGKLYEDLNVTYKIIDTSDKIVYIDSVMYLYRIRNSSIVRSSFNEKKMISVEFVDEMKECLVNENKIYDMACKARCFSLYMHIFRQIPNEERYIDLKKELYIKIKKYSLINIFNPKVRIKNRVAAIMSIFGFRFLIKF